MSESPREPAGAVLQIGDRCAAVPDANPCYSAHRWGEEEMCRASFFFLKERRVQREQLLCASAEEQGEIRALQEEREGGREGGREVGEGACTARTPASLSCQVDGRPRNMTWSYCRCCG